MKKLKINKENIKKHKKGIIAGTVAFAIAVGGTIGAIVLSQKDKDKIDLSNVTDDQLRNLTFDELMQYLEEGLKKENALTVYNFLDNFNGDLADSLYLEGDRDKKFQIPWDTAIAMVVGYNQFDATEMYEMFDQYDLRAEDLYKLIKGYTTMSIPAYLRLTNNTGIADLIQDQESSEFYLKYENKLIDMNEARFQALKSGSEEDENAFYAQAKAFNQMVRDDFLNDSGEVSFGSQAISYATGSRASVVPIISAALEITRNTPSRFSDEEIEQLNLDGYCNTIEETITTNVEKLETARMLAGLDSVTEATEEKNEEKEVTAIDIKYEIIRDAAIKQLTEENKYYISDELSTLPVVDFTKEAAEALTKQAETYTTTQAQKKQGSTTTKTYSSRDELVKDYPNLADEAKRQEDKINQQYEKENEEAKKKAQAEADKKADEKSKENEAAADKEIQDKNDNAEVKDEDGNVYDGYDVKPGNSGDVVIDDEHTTQDQNGNSRPNFDGPIYDSNGNIIAGKIGKIMILTKRF